MFAYTQNNALSVKLPRDRVAQLISDSRAQPLVMGGRVMKEWIELSHPRLEEYRQDWDILREAIRFAQAR